ncbi:hypothetical protein V6N13_091003 [Hibiscus sabdariffa]|uniref:Uncharacterized protein n=1 Tax=Hibiscus sabdariffa TaxID=183260 RepID=A0ABR2R2R8_9ROSI
MVSHSHQKNTQSVVIILPIITVIFSIPIDASNKILEEIEPVAVPQPSTTGIKCGACPCVNPCSQQSLPPPPSPPPPFPRFIYGNQLPTPPPPRFYYVTGVPGQLYPVDPDDRWTFFSYAEQNLVDVSLLLFCHALLGFFMAQ